MNKVILMGRLTKDPAISMTQSQNPMKYARYTLAVDRRTKQDGNQNADFISCIAFGKNADFVEKYLHQGTRIVVCGRIQTGSYTNQNGQKIYTTDMVAEEHYFAESKGNGQGNNQNQPQNNNYGQPQNNNYGQPQNSNYGQPQGGQQAYPQGQGFNNAAGQQTNYQQPQNNPPYGNGGFMNIPDGIDDELPFN